MNGALFELGKIYNRRKDRDQEVNQRLQNYLGSVEKSA